MGEPTIAGFKPLKLMQWRTHFYNRQPKVQVGRKMVETKVVDDLALPVKERWCYVIAETQDRQAGWEVIEEAFIDDRGRYHKVLVGSPYAPIKAPDEPSKKGSKPEEDRGEPSKKRPTHTVLFPKFRTVKTGPTAKDAAHDPLWVRLLFSPFRLPSTATQVLGEKFREQIADHVRPLWDWKKGNDPRSPLVITDSAGQEWSFDATPLWVTRNPTSNPALDKFDRVGVGFDPFTAAENLSLDYVQACEEVKRKLEAPNAPTKSKYQKMVLFDLIESTVMASSAGKIRYKSALDISKMNKAFKARKSQKKRLIRKRERTGGELCKLLTSPFIWLYQQASFSTEGLDASSLKAKGDDGRSPRIDEHIRWLGHCSRHLNQSVAGRALLSKWVEDSEKHTDHFINHLVLPAIVPPKHYFKSFRWGSKAIASVLAQFVSHKVAARQSWTAAQLGNELMTPLTKLAEIQGTPEWTWFKDGTFDPKKHIKGIGVAGDVIQTDDLNIKYLDVDVQVSPNKMGKLSVFVIEPENVDFITDWVDAGELKDFGRNAKLLDTKLLVGFILDGINVALSLNAAREQWGKSGQWTAVLDSSVATLSLVVNIADLYYQKLGASQTELLRVTRAFAAVRTITGAYYGYKDLRAARKGFREGDKDYGTAMYVAAGLEFTAAAATFYTAFAVGSSAGPWVGVIAGLLAAGAYIVAGLVKDDELERFLKRCDWGVSPYLDFDENPKWCTKDPSEWEEDFVLQQQMLLRILSQISVQWASHANETLGVTVRTQMLCPDSTISVKLIGTLADGQTIVDPFEFEGPSLPSKVPGTIDIRPSRTVNDWTHPRDLRAVVRFRLTPDSKVEVLDFPLILGGVDQKDEALSNV